MLGKLCARFDPQRGPNTNAVLRARDAPRLTQAKREVEEMLERVRASTIEERPVLRPLTAKTGFESPRERQ